MENRMGGILAAWIIPVSQVASTLCTRGTINVILATGAEWKDCRSMHMKTSPDDQVEVSDAGAICNSSITIESMASESDYLFFRDCLAAGCLIKVKKSNGESMVYGTLDYPMIGGIVPRIGSDPAEPSCYHITASNGTIDGPLALL